MQLHYILICYYLIYNMRLAYIETLVLVNNNAKVANTLN